MLRLRKMESHMLAIGGLLAGAALLAIVILAPLFRRPEPPRWTTYQLVGELITVAIVSLLALGIGSIGAGLVEAFRDGADAVQLGLFAASLAAVVAVWRWLNARTALAASATEAASGQGVSRPAGAPLGTAANEPGRPTPPKRPQPRRAA